MSSGTILTLNNLPDCPDAPAIGTIPGHELFPMVSVTRTMPSLWVHADGSLFQLFRIPTLDSEDIRRILAALRPGMAVQAYKLTEGGEISYYLALTHPLGYQYLQLGYPAALRRLFTGVEDLGRRLSVATEDGLDAIRAALPDAAEAVDWDGNPLLAFLVKYSLAAGRPRPLRPVKSNLGALLTGAGRFSAVCSMNNVEMIPASTGLLDPSLDRLLCVSIIRPVSDQEGGLLEAALATETVLSALSKPRADRPSQGNAPLSVPADADVPLFLNASFLLSSTKSLTGLQEDLRTFEAALGHHGLLLFHHSVSARAQYTALFPGNPAYGELFHTGSRAFCTAFLRKVTGL